LIRFTVEFDKVFGVLQVFKPITMGKRIDLDMSETLKELLFEDPFMCFFKLFCFVIVAFFVGFSVDFDELSDVDSFYAEADEASAFVVVEPEGPAKVFGGDFGGWGRKLDGFFSERDGC